MQFGPHARADWRVLVSAAVIGSGVGMALGAAYMAGGMARAADDHSRVSRIAGSADGRFSDQVLLSQTAGMDAGVLRLAQAHDPFSRQGAERDRQAAMFDLGLRKADLKEDAAKPSAARELDCLAQAVYFEARGETQQGQAAVAQVVLNRVKNPNFPKTICGVVFQGAASRGCQFSFACDGSMRRRLDAGAWSRARKVATRALSGAVAADIGSATHFHTTGVAPAWGAHMKRVAQVGLHVFYRFNPRGVSNAPIFVSNPVEHTPALRLTPALTEASVPAAVSAGSAAVDAPTSAPAAPQADSAAPAVAKGADAVAKVDVAPETTAS